MEAALNLALIEDSLGVKSTYFFLLRTEHYNLFSKLGSSYVHQILELGHNIGLHFDCAAYADNITAKQLAQNCNEEAELLERWFKQPIQVVSYHRPSTVICVGDPALSFPRPHTYMDVFTKKIKYVSDSRGEWRYGSPLASEAFLNKQPLHILTHPIWWQEDPSSPQRTLEHFLDRRSRCLGNEIAANCTAFKFDVELKNKRRE